MSDQNANLRRVAVHELCHAYTFQVFDLPVREIVVDEPKGDFYRGVTTLADFPPRFTTLQSKGYLVALTAGQVGDDRWATERGEEYIWGSENDYQYFEELRGKFLAQRPDGDYPDLTTAEALAQEALSIFWHKIVDRVETLAENRYLAGSAL